MTEALKGAQGNDVVEITTAAVNAAGCRDDTEKTFVQKLIETFVKILARPRPPVFVAIPVPGWPIWPDQREAAAGEDSGGMWPSWPPSAQSATTTPQIPTPHTEQDTEEFLECISTPRSDHETAMQQQSELPEMQLRTPSGLEAPRRGISQRAPQQREVIKVENKFEVLATLPKQKFKRKALKMTKSRPAQKCKGNEEVAVVGILDKPKGSAAVCATREKVTSGHYPSPAKLHSPQPSLQGPTPIDDGGDVDVNQRGKREENQRRKKGRGRARRTLHRAVQKKPDPLVGGEGEAAPTVISADLNENPDKREIFKKAIASGKWIDVDKVLAGDHVAPPTYRKQGPYSDTTGQDEATRIDVVRPPPEAQGVEGKGSPSDLIYFWCCICKRHGLPKGLIGDQCRCGHVQCLACRNGSEERQDCPHCPGYSPPNTPPPPTQPEVSASVVRRGEASDTTVRKCQCTYGGQCQHNVEEGSDSRYCSECNPEEEGQVAYCFCQCSGCYEESETSSESSQSEEDGHAQAGSAAAMKSTTEKGPQGSAETVDKGVASANEKEHHEGVAGTSDSYRENTIKRLLRLGIVASQRAPSHSELSTTDASESTERNQSDCETHIQRKKEANVNQKERHETRNAVEPRGKRKADNFGPPMDPLEGRWAADGTELRSKPQQGKDKQRQNRLEPIREEPPSEQGDKISPPESDDEGKHDSEYSFERESGSEDSEDEAEGGAERSCQCTYGGECRYKVEGDSNCCVYCDPHGEARPAYCPCPCRGCDEDSEGWSTESSQSEPETQCGHSGASCSSMPQEGGGDAQRVVSGSESYSQLSGENCKIDTDAFDNLIYGRPPVMAVYNFPRGDSRCDNIFQIKPKPSPLAKALVRTRFPAFRGGIAEVQVAGPHGLKMRKSDNSPHGSVALHVEESVAHEPDAPRTGDIVVAVNGITFPDEGGLKTALATFPHEATIIREGMKPPLGQSESGFFLIL